MNNVMPLISQSIDSAASIVYVNGVFDAEQSDIKCIENFLRVEMIDGDTAATKTTLHFLKNLKITKPILLLFTETEPTERIYVNTITVDENNQLTFVEKSMAQSPKESSIRIVTQLNAQKNSTIRYYRIQNDNFNSVHTSKVSVRQQTHSHVDCSAFTFGARSAETETLIDLMEPHATCRISALYLSKKNQQHHQQFTVKHYAPQCNSEQLCQGIADDNAGAHFGGNIYVARNAQKTQASQQNKNLLLSQQAIVTTLPQLEIFADDVKCSHGSTVGQLDKDALSYLQTRGLSKKEANALLSYGFVNELVEHIDNESIKNNVHVLLTEHLKGFSEIKELL